MTDFARARERREDNLTLEQKFKRLRRQLFWTLLTILVSVAAMSVTSVILSARAANQANKAQCPLFRTLDQAYKAQPPPTITGQLVATEIHQYVLIHC